MISSAECTDCRSCEIACSFHHIGAFDPTNSSITVHRDNKSRKVVLCLAAECDGCKDEPIPLCIKFCRRDVLTPFIPRANS